MSCSTRKTASRRHRRIPALVLGLFCAVTSIFVTMSRTYSADAAPNGPSAVNNAAVAWKALQYVGRWGGAACVDAQFSG